MLRKVVLVLLAFAVSSFAAPDTVKYTGAAARLPNMEMGIDLIIYDVSTDDSVGNQVLIELQGRNKLGSSVAALSNHTTWQKIYFNMVACPDVPNPADYPEVDSLITILIPDSGWIHLPTIATPLYDEIRVKIRITQSAARSLSDSNSRLFIQIHQRKETPYGKPVYKTLSDTVGTP